MCPHAAPLWPRGVQMMAVFSQCLNIPEVNHRGFAVVVIADTVGNSGETVQCSDKQVHSSGSLKLSAGCGGQDDQPTHPRIWQ